MMSEVVMIQQLTCFEGGLELSQFPFWISSLWSIKRTKQVQCNSLFSSPSLLTNEIDALCLRMCCFACCLFPRHFFARQIASVQPFTDLSNITLHLLSCRLLGIPSLARKRCLVLHLHGCCGWGTSHSVLSFLMLLRSLVHFYHFGIW